MQVTIQDLTSSAFAPYGTVIGPPGEPPAASGPGWRWWSETVTVPEVDGPYTIGYLGLAPVPLRFNWAEYHRRSPETIVPLGGDCLIYVGPASDEPRWEAFEVFHVRAGQGVVLREGIWHGAPLAMDRPTSVLVLLRQGTGEGDVSKATRREGSIEIVGNTQTSVSGG